MLAWLSARRSENTRAAYARDIGITPQRRPGRAPSWLAWCQQQEVHPVTGVTGLHVARYARQLDHTGLCGQRGPQARRHLQLVRVAGPARAYHRQPRRRHRPAPPRPAHPRRPGPHPGPGPRAHPRGRHRARPAARPHRGTDRRPAVHRCPAQRGNRCRRRRPRHQRRAPGALGHPRRRPGDTACHCPARPRPGSTPTSPPGPARPAIKRYSPPGPAGGYSPPTCATPSAASPPAPACPPTRPATWDRGRSASPSPRCTSRPERPLASIAARGTQAHEPPSDPARPGIQIHHYGPEAGLTAAPAALNTPQAHPASLVTPETPCRRRDQLARRCSTRQDTPGRFPRRAAHGARGIADMSPAGGCRAPGTSPRRSYDRTAHGSGNRSGPAASGKCRHA